MEESSKTFLVSLVNLDTKLRANDSTAMAEVAYIKSFTDLTVDQRNEIFDIMLSIIDVSDGSNKDLITSALTELDIPDKDYLLETLKMPLSLDDLSKDELITHVDDVLTRPISIENPQRQFVFYSKCVYLAIMSRDANLIAKAISKVQSL